MRILWILLVTTFLSMGSSLKASTFYVTNFNGTVGSPGTFISVIDSITNTVTGYVDTTGFNLTHPIEIHFNQAGTQAYVVCNSVNAVYVIDVASNTIVGAVNDALNPFSAPNDIEIPFNTNKAYVANESGGPGGNGTVGIIDLSVNLVTGAVNDTLGPVSTPVAIAASDDGTKALVMNLSGHNVSILDTATNTITGYVNDIVHPFVTPVYGAWSGSSKVYVLDAGGGSGFVNVVVGNAVTGTVSTGIFPPFSVPENIIEGPDGKMYIVDTGNNHVYIVDPTTNAVTNVFTGTFSFPLGITITSDNSTAYVANIGNNTTSIIDIATSTQTGIVNDIAFPFFGPYQMDVTVEVPPPPTLTVSLRPTCIEGKQKTDVFASQYELYNTINWCPSPTQSVTHYNVYRNGTLIKSVNAGQDLSYTEENVQKDVVTVYSITAVGPLGESPAVTVSVP